SLDIRLSGRGDGGCHKGDLDLVTASVSRRRPSRDPPGDTSRMPIDLGRGSDRTESNRTNRGGMDGLSSRVAAGSARRLMASAAVGLFALFGVPVAAYAITTGQAAKVAQRGLYVIFERSFKQPGITGITLTVNAPECTGGRASSSATSQVERQVRVRRQ